MITAPVFRFEEARHEYFLNDQRIPSITQLLKLGGLVTGEHFYTEQSRDRGIAVHALCTGLDDCSIDVHELATKEHAGYALGYLAACRQLTPKWERVEEADFEPTLKFAGRLDREGIVLKRVTVAEIKSAVKAKHHAIQTALQALMIAARRRLKAEQIQRLCIYLKANGKYQVDLHQDKRDFDQARELVRRFC